MASMRVHELAKEFGMDSKVLLSRIQDLKIAAKSHASVLSEANVEKIREALAPELGAKAAAGMDAEAAAKARPKRLPPTRRMPKRSVHVVPLSSASVSFVPRNALVVSLILQLRARLPLQPLPPSRPSVRLRLR